MTTLFDDKNQFLTGHFLCLVYIDNQKNLLAVNWLSNP